MKGYRTPSWFRMKGLGKKSKAQAAIKKRKPGKSKLRLDK